MALVHVVLEVLVEEEEQRTLGGTLDQTRPYPLVEARESLVSVGLDTDVPVVVVLLVPSLGDVLVLLDPSAHGDQGVGGGSADHFGHSPVQERQVVHTLLLYPDDLLHRLVTVQLDHSTHTQHHRHH